MLIRLHRWQPKPNRFRTQIFNLNPGEDASPFMDILFRRGVQVNSDPTVNQIIARTQQVDRVLFNAIDGSIDVWLSPIVERKYEHKHPASAGVTVTKKKLGTVTCECHHLASDHGDKPGRQNSGVCLIPRCGCKGYLQKQDSLADLLTATRTSEFEVGAAGSDLLDASPEIENDTPGNFKDVQ